MPDFGAVGPPAAAPTPVRVITTDARCSSRQLPLASAARLLLLLPDLYLQQLGRVPLALVFSPLARHRRRGRRRPRPPPSPPPPLGGGCLGLWAGAGTRCGCGARTGAQGTPGWC